MTTPLNQPPRTIHRLLVALVLIGSVVLTACDEADWDLLSAWGEDWAATNNVWDGENLDMGNLVRLTAEQQVDAIFNGPDPALQAGNVVDDIRRADDLANQANFASQLDHPQDAINDLNQAIALRPKDFTYVQQRAAASLSNGDVSAYETDAAKATSIMERQVQDAGSTEACHRIYREFYQHQLDVLDQAFGMACAAHGQCDYISSEQQYYSNALATVDSAPCD